VARRFFVNRNHRDVDFTYKQTILESLKFVNCDLKGATKKSAVALAIGWIALVKRLIHFY
jgi:hypothetical protein